LVFQRKAKKVLKYTVSVKVCSGKKKKKVRIWTADFRFSVQDNCTQTHSDEEVPKKQTVTIISKW